MENLKLLGWIIAPIALTSLLCWTVSTISLISPLIAILVYPVGILGILLTVDSL
jgi:hypothetical protein